MRLAMSLIQRSEDAAPPLPSPRDTCRQSDNPAPARRSIAERTQFSVKLDPPNIGRDLFRWAGLVLLSQANGAIQVSHHLAERPKCLFLASAWRSCANTSAPRASTTSMRCSAE